MKRFLLFAGDIYYPVGGWNDFVGAFDSAEEAVNSLKNPKYLQEDDENWDLVNYEYIVTGKVSGCKMSVEWFHVIDSLDMQEVKRYRR